MAEDLGHDLAAGAGRHRLLDEVAGLVDRQAVTPEYADIGWLADEVRLERNDNRSQPVRIRKRDQTALARDITGQVADDTHERVIVQGRGERYPPRLLDMIREHRRSSKGRSAGGKVLPKRPRAAAGFAIHHGCRVHAAQT